MPTEIIEYSKTEQALATLREQYGDATYDVTTTDGMEAAKAARKDVRGYRTGLEAMRKQIKAPALAQCNLIDSEARRITEELRELEDPIAKQIKDHEDELETVRQNKIAAETKRVEDIQARIKAMRDVVQSVTYMGNPTSEAVQLKIDDIQAIKIDASFAEFADQVIQAKEESLAKLFEIHTAAVQREEEDKRLTKEREELDARKAEQDKRDKAAQGEIDAANKKLADERAAFGREQEEKAEEERKAEEAEKAEMEKARKAKALAKRSEFPGEEAIINALAVHFDVSVTVAASWLTQLRKAA